MLATEGDKINSQQRKKTIKRITLEVIIAVLLIVPAIVLCFYWKQLIINRVLKAVNLKPNTAGFKTWLNPPTAITRGYHLFNITNPIDIVTDPASTTVHLKETLPYSYILSASKKDVEWSEDNSALSYSIHRVFTRHPDRFNPSSVNDTGVFVDLLRATVRTQFQVKPSPTFFAIGGLETFYHRNAVDQLEGFTSDLFNILKEKMIGPNTAKSGFIYRYNGSRSYNYTIKAGLMEKGQVLAFASENAPVRFSTPTPYDFTIYDGLTFVPMLFDKPSMNIYQADFCRPINVKFNKIIRMFGGIDVHEYVIRLVDFDKCTNSSDINTCPEVDKLDVSKCISSSLPENTVFLSKAHFYGSSNETMKEMNIEGFTPIRDKHEALIYFEPYSGTPLRAHHRVQLNINAMIDPMRQSEYGSELEWANRRGVHRLVPLVFIDQEVNVDSAFIRTLRFVHLAIRYGQWVIMIVAIVLAAIIIVAMELKSRRAAKNARMQPSRTRKPDPLLKH